MMYEYMVLDELYHSIGMEANCYFATNELWEAKLVVNEVGFRCVVVRYDPVFEEHELVCDARFNAELALDF